METVNFLFLCLTFPCTLMLSLREIQRHSKLGQCIEHNSQVLKNKA